MAIYPVHFLDDRKDARKTVMGWIFRVNARLDAGKVCAALRRVLEIGNWRKLAGTLHHNVSPRKKRALAASTSAAIFHAQELR